MHIAKFTEEKSGHNTDTRSGILTLTHTNDGKVVDVWQMWNIGSGGFHIKNSKGEVVSESGYGMHDLCWDWLINKAVEIQELNN